MVKHSFDCLFSFAEPPEIRTVEGFSAVFAFVRCEHRLCSRTTCATPGYIRFLPAAYGNSFFGRTSRLGQRDTHIRTVRTERCYYTARQRRCQVRVFPNRVIRAYPGTVPKDQLRSRQPMGYPGVSGNGPPFVDAEVLSTGHPGASGDDRSGTGRAGSRPGHPGVMVYSAAAAHIDEGEHS